MSRHPANRNLNQKSLQVLEWILVIPLLLFPFLAPQIFARAGDLWMLVLSLTVVVAGAWSFKEQVPLAVPRWALLSAACLLGVLTVRAVLLPLFDGVLLGEGLALGKSVAGLAVGMGWCLLLRSVAQEGQRKSITLGISWLLLTASLWLLAHLIAAGALPTGAFGHPFQTMAIAIAAVLFLAAKDNMHLWHLFPLSIVLFSAWSFDAPALSVVFAGACALLATKQRGVFGGAALLIAILLLLSALSPFPTFGAPGLYRFFVLARPAWSTTVDVFRSLPLVSQVAGAGMGRFGEAYVFALPASVAAGPFGETMFSQGASSLGTALVTFGVLGVLWLFALLWALVPNGISRFSLGMTLVLAALFVGWPVAPMTSWLLVAGWIVSVKGDGEEKGPQVGRWFPAIMTGAISVVVVLFVLRFTAAAIYASGVQAATRQDTDAARKRMSVALLIDRTVVTEYGALSQLLFTEAQRALATEPPQTELATQRAQEAVRAATLATTLRPDRFDAWRTRGKLYLRLLEVADDADAYAVQMFEHARSLAPNHVGVLLDLAEAHLATAKQLAPYQEEGDVAKTAPFTQALDDATAVLADAQALNPKLARTYRLQSVIADLRGDRAEATRVLEEGRKVAPKDVGVATQLGMLYSLQGKQEMAKAELERILTFSPAAVEARWYLTYVLEALGDKDGALREAKELARRYPDSVPIGERVKQIEEEKPADIPTLEPSPVTEPVVDAEVIE